MPSPVLLSQPCPVPFQDCSERTGGIGWAQQIRWGYRQLARSHGSSDDLCFSARVPAGTTVDDFLSAIGRVVSRHESLRTRFHSDGNRVARQEAVGSGEVDVIRCRVRAGDDLTDKLLRGRVREEPLDIENGFPFRIGFAASGDEVTHVAFAASSVIADAAGCENVVSSFTSELLANGEAQAFQQLDQVEWEASEAGLRAERRATAYWRDHLAAVHDLPRPSVARGEPVRSIVLPADSLLNAAEEVSPTCGTSSSGVLLTAFLQATAHTLGLDAFGCYLHCSNRTGLDRHRSITRLKNVTVFSYSPGSTDFRSAVREVFQASLEAYRHAQSPGELFLSRLGVGPGHAPFVHFNDVRSVVARDGVTGPGRPGPEVDPNDPAMIETASGHTDEPALLNLGVGAVMGTSPEPVLKFETNLLRADGISLLVERMKQVLAAA